MTTSTAQIPHLLRPGVNKVFTNYDTYPEEWTEIFKASPSNMAYETDVEYKSIGPADLVNEGSPIPVDTMEEAYTTVYRMKKFGIGFTLTQEAIADNLYKNQFYDRARALRNSLSTTKNQLGANVLNNAFNTSYTIADGQPLCSATHPIVSGGVYSNKLTASGNVTVDFSEGAVEQMLIMAENLPGQNGILAHRKGKKLVVGRGLRFAASRLLNSAFRTDTANNDISAIYNDSSVPNGYTVNHYLTSPTAFFLLTDEDNAFRLFQRENVQTDVYADMDTKSVKINAWERYAFGVNTARGVIGSEGV